MSTVLEFAKQKSISLVSSTINGKRCCSAYSTTRKKDKRLPNLGKLQIEPRNSILKVRMTTEVKSEEPKETGTKGCSPSTDVTEKRECRKNSLKSEEPKETATKGCRPSTDVTEKGEYRKNSLNIQMLSKSLHRQIFGDTLKSHWANQELIHKAKEQLREHGLLGNEISYLKDVELNLPPLRGKNIEEHFFSIGEEQSKPYRELVNSFIKSGIPNPPNEWLCQKGWTKYVEGKEPVSVPFPDDDILIFDVEVCVRLGELPTLATAVSSSAWYGWVCSDLAEGINPIPKKSYSTSMLIPFEGKTVNKEKPRLIVGHNVSYDRARIREQYYLKNSALHFLDTMALHICIGGINKAQKIKLASGKTIETEEVIEKELCLCSLKELYSLYCGKELDKEQRNIFVEGLMPDVKNDFQNLMKYCAKDVKATYEVLQVIFPIFLKRFSHPVTLAGMLEMGSGFLPVNENWNKFLIEAEETYEDLKSEISSILSEKCDNACRLLYNEEFKKDLWMWSEDWTTQTLKLTKKKVKPKVNEIEDAKKSQEEEEEEDQEEKALQMKYQYLFDLKEVLPKRPPFLPGYPLWYRKLCEKPDSLDWTSSPQLTTSMYITPKLLNLTWENFPLHHTQEHGWGILIPDLFAENVETSIPFEKLKELTIKNLNIDLTELEQKMLNLEGKKGNEISESRVSYYKGSGVWCNHIIDNCCFFFKIPHKNGGNKNVGNPLSKDIGHVFVSGVFRSSDSSAEKVLDLAGKITYWRNSRQRITSQMVVWLNKKEANITNGSDEQDTRTGIIIPKVVVCGTLTRRAMENTWLTASKVTLNRIGSELRSMIQAPPGYHFVGADVDSQELWIASLIGDSHYAKVHGSTPLGWMTLSGTKPAGTDMHSVTAKAVGISRDHAKIINYARIYGAGVKFAEKLLKQFNPSMSEDEARTKVIKMYSLTKGIKEFKVKKSVLNEFNYTFGPNLKICDLSSAAAVARKWKKKMEDIFEKAQWVNGTESAMFNQLEKIATSSKPVTPFLQCRLSRALEPRYDGDDLHLKTRINWVVQSGAVDFLHLMLVCMKWLTNGKARYCFSFHDEVRYMIPSEERYNGALALHITNLLVRCFCAHRLGMYDLPQSVAFFSSVEVDKSLRKEANDDCVTPSNPHGIEKEYGIEPGESLSIYEAIEKSGGSLSGFGTTKKRAPALSSTQSSQKSEEFKTEMSQATKRKHVHREILHGALVPPTENQQIVRVLGSRGSNLHEVETAEATTFLASMPSKFRKNVWIKRGDYILVEPIEEGGKVKAEIVNILTADYIKFLKKESIWPSEFSKNTEEATTSSDDFFVNNNRKPIFSENETLE